MATPRLAPAATHPLSGASSHSSCEIVTSFDRLESFADDWTRIWTADSRAEIFQTFEFARAWWKAYEDTVRLRAAVVWRGPDVIGVLPLVQRCRTLRFLGAPEFDYNDVICREEDSGEVLAVALRSLSEAGPWDAIELGNLASTSRIMRYSPVFRTGLPLKSLIIPGARCPTILLDNGREGTLRSLAAGHHHRRHKNKLRKLGHLSFRHIEESYEALLHLEQFFRQQIRRRALCETHSRFCEKGFRSMCQSLMNEFDPAKELRLGVLELDGRPLAYSLGFEANGKFLLYQQSFDIDDWHLAVGDVLLHSLFEYAAGQDVHEFDFSVGMEPYKEKFANEIKCNHDLHFFRSSISGRIRRLERLASSRGILIAERLRSTAHALASFLSQSSFLRVAMARLSALGRKSPKPEVLFEGASSIDGTLQHNSGVRENSDLHFRSVRLSALADLSLEYGEILTLNRLLHLRDRIRSGEKVWVGFDRSQLVLLVTVQRELNGVSGRAEFLPDGKAALTSAFVMEEIWSSGAYRLPERRRGLFAALLRSMNWSGPCFIRTSVKIPKS